MATQLAASRAVLSSMELVSTYRSQSGDYDYFFNKIDYTLNSFHKYNSEFKICGDININYMETNNKSTIR
jgi:hypothetical protein